MHLKAFKWSAAVVVATTMAGCSVTDTIHGQPTTPAGDAALELPQPEFSSDRIAERDPARVLREGLFEMLRQPLADFVAITGYRQQIAADGETSKVSAYAFIPPNGTWERIPDAHVVWSRDKAEWVLSERTETISAGPLGDGGVPTLRIEAVYGTAYFTYSYEELDGKPLEDGLESGFGFGRPLPQSAAEGRFSPGARAYVATETVVDPFYTIHQVKNANTKVDEPMAVYACGRPSPECATPATSLDMVEASGGQFTNFAGTVRLELEGGGNATLLAAYNNVPLATLTYRSADADGPPRIKFEGSAPEDAESFGGAMGIGLEDFAFFEYDGQVVVGAAQPAHTNDAFVGYNRIAANDLVTQWTPALPQVLP